MKNTKLIFLHVLFLAPFLIGYGQSSTDLKTIKAYLNASTVEQKGRFMAEDFHSYFAERKGKGEDKKKALAGFQQWDGHLHPDVAILSHEKKENGWLVYFNEQNDFSKLIGYPGWKASMWFSFDRQGLIMQTIYFPDTTNLPYKKWLQPAVDWLKIHMPGELNTVYQDNKLVKTEAAATKWKALLQKWRAQRKEVNKE